MTFLLSDGAQSECSDESQELPEQMPYDPVEDWKVLSETGNVSAMEVCMPEDKTPDSIMEDKSTSDPQKEYVATDQIGCDFSSTMDSGVISEDHTLNDTTKEREQNLEKAEAGLDDTVTKDDASEDSFATASSGSPRRFRGIDATKVGESSDCKKEMVIPLKQLGTLNISSIPQASPSCRLNTFTQDLSFAPDISTTEVITKELVTNTSTPVAATSSHSCDEIFIRAKDNSMQDQLKAMPSASAVNAEKSSSQVDSSQNKVLNTSSLDAWLSFETSTASNTKTVQNKETSDANAPEVGNVRPKANVPPLLAQKAVKNDPSEPTLSTAKSSTALPHPRYPR